MIASAQIKAAITQAPHLIRTRDAQIVGAYY